ncbi:MalM family protein [Psychromonas antarctica]|uniref:MalM family protein n=1 Tax=Psychromonas antarctica TaxID=67573 RepID=UPI001EE7A6E2|nr:MalM family protein [Psychromonas antarctica]MCG6201416.1 MalM family protein [Psychromonas antarctica]
MIIKQSSFILAASLVISGCSNTTLQSPREIYGSAFINQEQASQALARKEACCDDFSQLRYQEINSNNDLFIPLDSDSQVYNFASGKSFVQAYKLTSNNSELKLQISAIIANTVVAPQITLLDTNFHITRTIPVNQFTYKTAKLLAGDVLSTELTIFRPQSNNVTNETYLLFYTTNQAVLGSTTIIHPAKSFAKAHGTVEPDIADPIIPHSAMGLIKLESEEQGAKTDDSNSYIPKIISSLGKATKLPTEQEFNQKIIAAVVAKEIDKALTIVKEAEANGSQTARETFVKALNKPSDSQEKEFNQAIVEAVAAQDINKALTIVDEAEAAGSRTARDTFIDAVKKQ